MSYAHARAAGRQTPPSVIYHATTPRKLDRYRASRRIIPPVRGFRSLEAARQWGLLHGPRTVVLAVRVPGAVFPLPDHHIDGGQGTAWWSPDDCPDFVEVPRE